MSESLTLEQSRTDLCGFMEAYLDGAPPAALQRGMSPAAIERQALEAVKARLDWMLTLLGPAAVAA